MKARMILATVVAALVGIPVGALALRDSAVDREDGVITRSDDDGTADQGRGDAPRTRKARSTDDDGTADQGHGDAPGTAGSGADDSGHDDHGGNSGSDDREDDNSGHGSGSDDD